MVIGLAPRGGGNGCHLWVFGTQVSARFDNVTVIRGGQHFAILKDAGGLADLDGTRFQDFDFVDDDLLCETHDLGTPSRRNRFGRSFEPLRAVCHFP